MKIYTKTGDRGTTTLFKGLRVKKSNKIVEALGAIDELNAWMGILKLTGVQKDLMTLSSNVAGYNNKVLGSRVQWLEKEINKMQETLPKLQNFILPKGQIHLARAVCRRAERRLVDADVHRHDAIKYLNRLGDYLFVLARFVNLKKKSPETIWKS